MFRILLASYLILSFVLTNHAQNNSVSELGKRFYDAHGDYKAGFITHRRFKHSQIMSHIDQLGDLFKVRTVGVSNENRELKLISVGAGPESVLLWSQMHGNEMTATMALMDVFNFLSSENDDFGFVRNAIFENLTVHFIPMLNPDGAERFVRRNTQGIDINRDALRLQTPEGRTLKSVRDSLDANWGFNLHDQGRTTYVVDKPATISVLAPAYDLEKSVNEKREDAMQLISLMNSILQEYIPGQVSRYWDDFEPRAFGDNIQKWGTRTILIESGGQYRDREKQEIRKLNFVILLSALYGIATDGEEIFTQEDYFKIPDTNRGFRDVILKNVLLPESMGGYLTDIGINFQEVENTGRTDFYLRPNVVDIGDLSTSGAYLIHDVSGLETRPGKVYEKKLTRISDIEKLNLKKLIGEGYTDFIVLDEPDRFELNLPIRIHVVDPILEDEIGLNDNPSLLFYQNGQLKFVFVNGSFFNPEDSLDKIVQELSFR